MALYFDSFPTVESAEAFVAEAKRLGFKVITFNETAIERKEGREGEEELIALAEKLGGSFSGT